MDPLALPTDDFEPTGLSYRIWDNTLAIDRIVIDVDLGNDQWLPRATVDEILRPHMQAAYCDLLAAALNKDVAFKAAYRGVRLDDVTPPPPAGE